LVDYQKFYVVPDPERYQVLRADVVELILLDWTDILGPRRFGQFCIRLQVHVCVYTVWRWQSSWRCIPLASSKSSINCNKSKPLEKKKKTVIKAKVRVDLSKQTPATSPFVPVCVHSFEPAESSFIRPQASSMAAVVVLNQDSFVPVPTPVSSQHNVIISCDAWNGFDPQYSLHLMNRILSKKHFTLLVGTTIFVR
jgi:hypothetical protein